MKPAVNVYNIGQELPFSGTLAAWIVEHYSPGEIARLRVLLPNRRACRTLREAFLRQSGGKPMLLPRIHPIGDWETEDLPPDLLSAEIMQSIPPAMDKNRRLLLLTRLVMEFESRRERQPQAAQAIRLAAQLASFLDEITRENIDIFSLARLVPITELAAHWQQTVDFLTILSQHWPRLLQEEGVIDPIERRNRVLKAVAGTWINTPPGYPIIAAGSTGTQPATAELLSAIARLPQGKVVLPGLDREMVESDWEILGPSHPQHALKLLLEQLGTSRDLVVPIAADKKNNPRLECLRAVFQPAASTANWLGMHIPLEEGLQGLQTFTAESEADEARIIAVALRETLETPEKTAALITPDRALASRVSAQMERFGIAIDDSGGVPLLDTPPGVYMRLIAECALSNGSPVQLLALLRHPLTGAGYETVECRNLSRFLEKIYLRGVRHHNGLQGLCSETKDKHPELYSFLSYLEKEFRQLFNWISQKNPIAVGTLLSEHIRLAEALAATANTQGEERLWAGDAGAQLAGALAEIKPQLDVLPPIAPQSYPALFEGLLAGVLFRPRYGKHPRLSILSPIEARLQQFDRVILAGLNEDTWPARPGADPWLSRPMRAEFGLPPLERTIGQAAHDVVQLIASTPDVLLTRAKKLEGKPTVASRWLVRLDTLLRGKNVQQTVAFYYAQAKSILDKPSDIQPIARPMPCPSLAARPKTLSATMIEKWQRDPYIVYASSILRLKKLDELDKEPGSAEFGTLVHAALKLYSDRYPHGSLIDCGREVFDTLLARPAVEALWWPRFEALATWFLSADKKRRNGEIQVITEREGKWPLDVDGKSFAFTTRIDRAEIDKHGRAVIVDYKTGSLPESSEVRDGLAAQLPVEGLIALYGVCNPPLPPIKEIDALEYWRLAGSEENCKIWRLEDKKGMNAKMLLEHCQSILTDLVRESMKPDYTYAAQTNKKLVPRYSDYDHLTRRKEWGEG